MSPHTASSSPDSEITPRNSLSSQASFDTSNHTETYHCYCPLPFPSCTQTFNTYDTLTAHVTLVQTNMQILQCPLCPQSFTRALHFDEHLRTEHPNCPDVKCQCCGHSFPGVGRLRDQGRSVHGVADSRQCRHCGEVVEGFKAYLRHLSEHWKDGKRERRSSVGEGVKEEGTVKREGEGVRIKIEEEW